MKFWKNIANSLGTLDRRGKRQSASLHTDRDRHGGSGSLATPTGSANGATPSSYRKRRSQYSNRSKGGDSIYEEFRPCDMGTTFVELIKRPGTYLGVVVSEKEPRIAQLVPGSWAQRSDVLCVGDKICSVNGKSNFTLINPVDNPDQWAYIFRHIGGQPQPRHASQDVGRVRQDPARGEVPAAKLAQRLVQTKEGYSGNKIPFPVN